MSKHITLHRGRAVESHRIDPPPDDAESWEGHIPGPRSQRRLPMPVYPVIPQQADEPSRELLKIATVLYSSFERCIWAFTEKQAGNDLLILVHGRLHKRLDDLRTIFLQNVMAKGIAYKEAADPFDAMLSAFNQFSLITAYWMFDEEGRKKSRPGERWKAAAVEVSNDYASAKATLDRMLDFVQAHLTEATETKNGTPKRKRRVKRTKEQTVQMVRDAIANKQKPDGRDAPKDVIAKHAGIRKAECLKILAALKKKGEYNPR